MPGKWFPLNFSCFLLFVCALEGLDYNPYVFTDVENEDYFSIPFPGTTGYDY